VREGGGKGYITKYKSIRHRLPGDASRGEEEIERRALVPPHVKMCHPSKHLTDAVLHTVQFFFLLLLHNALKPDALLSTSRGHVLSVALFLHRQHGRSGSGFICARSLHRQHPFSPPQCLVPRLMNTSLRWLHDYDSLVFPSSQSLCPETEGAKVRCSLIGRLK